MAAATFPFWWMFLMRIGRLSWLALLSVAVCGAVPNVTLAAEVESVGEIVSRLVSASRIYDKRQMRSASERLVEIGAEAVPGLMSVVDDVDDNVRWQAIAALGRIGRPAATVSIPLMTAACADRDADVRGAAAVALGQMRVKEEAAVRAVRLLRRDEQPMVRADAWWAWWQATGDRKAITELVDLLSAKDWLASSHASHHLSTVGSPAVKVLVEKMIAGPSRDRRQVAETLRRMGPRAVTAIPKLLRVLDGKDRHVAAAAARVLGTQGAAAVIGLRDRLDAPRADTRRLAVVALGEIGPPASSAAAKMAGRLEFVEGRELLQLVTALGRIGSKATVAVPGLVVILKHSHRDSRGAACEALGRIGSAAHGATEALSAVAEGDPVDFVRRAAQRANAEIIRQRAGQVAAKLNPETNPVPDELRE